MTHPDQPVRVLVDTLAGQEALASRFPMASL
jgi:hypothetical protein